jgi:hypothetical protein
MRFRVSELLEREFKLVPNDGASCSQDELCRLLAAAGIDAVEDDNTFQERDYWDGREVPLAHRNMSCTLADGSGGASIEVKMPMGGQPYLYREFTWHGEGRLETFRDPWFWNAPGLATVRSTFATTGEFHAFVASLRKTAACRARRTYYWLTDDEICKRGDYFAHDTVLVFDRVQGFIDGKAVRPYLEIEIEVTRWAPLEISEIAQRAVDALLAHGFRHAPVSKYRRICQLGGLLV